MPLVAARSRRRVGNRHRQQFDGLCHPSVSAQPTTLIQLPPSENLVAVDPARARATRATDAPGSENRRQNNFLKSICVRFVLHKLMRSSGIYRARV